MASFLVCSLVTVLVALVRMKRRPGPDALLAILSN